MASAPFSHLILFIASMIVAANVVGVLATEVNTVREAIEDQSFDIAEKLRADVAIINDPAEPVYDLEGNGNITIYVKNTGSRTLPFDPADVDVVFNGQFETALNITVKGDTEWTPGAVAKITFDHSDPGNGEHRIKVVVEGAEDTFVFRGQ